MEGAGGDASVTWELELGAGGEVLGPPDFDSQGVLRIGATDVLVFCLPAGSAFISKRAELIVLDEHGEESRVQGARDGPIGDWRGEWRPSRPGPYEFFARRPAAADGGGAAAQGPVSRIIVDPTLSIRGEPLPARAVVQLTVLARLAGPIEKWPEALAPQAALGYNMVHFTPIQPPGESGSCYSLDDQSTVDPSLMEAPAATPQARLQAVNAAVERLESEDGMLSAMDIVLNHTAGTAPWLLDHPDSAYSVSNSPHLAAAAELDERLAWFSDELRDGRLGGPRIESHGDIDRVMDGIRQHVLGPLNLAEYFRIDIDACLENFRAARVAFEREEYEALKVGALPSLGARREGASVPGDVTRRHCKDEAHLRECLHRLANDFREEFFQLERDILEALRGGIMYERLECRKGLVGDGHLALCPRYFRRLSLSASARERLGRDHEIVAHNGWVMGWPATEDFAAPSWRHVYLRRHLCAWGDCVKLRFGNGPDDAPFVWDHMTRYAVSMAKIFHAIRLDNAHSTPLHVSRHVLAQVRRANPNCWIFAELFTGDFQTDLLYQATLGINALIREAMQCGSPAELCGHLGGRIWGAHDIGEVSSVATFDRQPAAPKRSQPLARSASCALVGTLALPLRPRSCPALLFDCTHDNQTPFEKRHPRDALPNAALVAASGASIGSVRGYDELLPFNPSVVFERRLYAEVPKAPALSLRWPGLAASAAAPPLKTEAEAESARAEVVWPHEALESVFVHGSWDGWREPVVLQLQADGRWTASLDVPPYALPAQYKFVIDGQWICDASQPTACDRCGNVNNVLRATGAMGVASGEGHAVAPLPPGLPGIFAAKQVLNVLHSKLACEGFVEIGAQQLAADVVAVQRRSPNTCQRTWFVVRSAFARDLHEDLGDTAALEFPGEIADVHLAATLYAANEARRSDSQDALHGLQSELRAYGSLGDLAEVSRDGSRSILRLRHFPPGSVLVFSTAPGDEARCQAELDDVLAGPCLQEALRDLPISELSYLLFSCDAEELDRSEGARGAYDVEGHGPLVYCGLLGPCAVLDAARRGGRGLAESPVVRNIRAGDWLIGYLTDRLCSPALVDVRDCLARVRDVLARLPRDVVAFHFDSAVAGLCAAAARALLPKQSDRGNAFGCNGDAGDASALLRDLLVATAQFWAATRSAPLSWNRAQEVGWRNVPSLCAGLPHFAAGFMRNWGRDTFIALRGCLLATGRFAEARDTLLVYASVVRHGLCPNLLDAANRPRYNARDATWFFLQAIQDYAHMAPEGEAFLAAPVELKWPVREWDDELTALEPKTIAELIHLILSAHAKGIRFREWNAGKSIDEHMADAGFEVTANLDEETGIIYGGNEWNCGTWMDKMGSSDKAGNRGVPATPRDGAAVEITGLLKSVLRWVKGLKKDVFPFEAVRTATGAVLTYAEWDARLQKHFERLFWVSEDEFAPSKLRGFYKDTVGATRQWQDFQLRPNFPIAMAVAPELFTADRASRALDTAVRLCGPLGMCTLDPSDEEYRGDYHNDDDSMDKAVAHGWNYHQGPEWVWPLGFFLKACHRFRPAMASNDDELLARLLPHRSALATGQWRSLPELTNSKGSVCHHSCPAQAWSVATLLDALHTIAR